MDERKKRCCTCHLELPLSMFNRRSRAKDGLQSRCRACAREWYLANRDSHRANVAPRRTATVRAIKERLVDYLREHPCVDCGQTDLRVLDFDHRDPGTKVGAVSFLVNNSTWEAVAAEVEKCDVRCANCHRIRTCADRLTFRHRHQETIEAENAARAAARLAALFPKAV